MPSKKKIAAFKALYSNLTAKIVGNVFAFLASVLIIRLLSVKDFGTFSLFLSFLSLLGGLSLGVHHVYQRYIAVYAEKKSDMVRVVKFTTLMVGLRIVIFATIILFLYILQTLKIITVSSLDFPYIFLAVITTVAVICKITFHEGLLSGYLNHRFYNMFDNCVTIMKVVVIFTFRPTSVIGFIYIWLALEIVRVSGLLIRFIFLVYRDRVNFPQDATKRLEFRRYLSYGKYFIFASIASHILAFDIDNYFLAYFKGNEAVGLYSFAIKIAYVLVGFAPVNILFNVITPMIIKEYEKHKERAKIRDAIAVLFKVNIFVYSIMVFFVSINVFFVIEVVFQSAYLAAVPYIYSLVIFSFMPVIKNTFEPVVRALEKSKIYFFTFIAALINILGNILLIPHFGITGAVISTGIAISLQSIAFIIFAVKEIKFCFDSRFFLKLFVNFIPIVAIGFFLQRWISSILSFIIVNTLLIVVVFVLFRMNRCFSSEESNFVNSYLPRRLFIF